MNKIESGGVVRNMILSQKTVNHWHSKMCDEILNAPAFYRHYKPTPISKWRRFKNKISRLTEYRLVHQDRIDCEEW